MLQDKEKEMVMSRRTPRFLRAVVTGQVTMAVLLVAAFVVSVSPVQAASSPGDRVAPDQFQVVIDDTRAIVYAKASDFSHGCLFSKP